MGLYDGQTKSTRKPTLINNFFTFFKILASSIYPKKFKCFMLGYDIGIYTESKRFRDHVNLLFLSEFFEFILLDKCMLMGEPIRTDPRIRELV